MKTGHLVLILTRSVCLSDKAYKELTSISYFVKRQFREVFGKVLGGNLSYDQMTMLFMKIDANSDGTIDWDEFSTYMMMGAIQMEQHVSPLDR
jgi:Ca2+-binding EF-hand superfamily protein